MYKFFASITLCGVAGGPSFLKKGRNYVFKRPPVNELRVAGLLLSGGVPLPLLIAVTSSRAFAEELPQNRENSPSEDGDGKGDCDDAGSHEDQNPDDSSWDVLGFLRFLGVPNAGDGYDGENKGRKSFQRVFQLPAVGPGQGLCDEDDEAGGREY